ncbi:response regulator receiver domain protein [Treponema lecithinolyticum ATCC 700332]|uniref:Response regulator receiver domain protein n=2 Tax=Treponema lecithinolyticum TaxID=53418 RepID=A0ABN0NZT4_TRELE|nr:response regulator receiver domain protein [Treponema lecithinolyticum ATCC 700332]
MNAANSKVFGAYMKIMLVDDDIHVLNGLQKLLKITAVQGKIICAVHNGAQALEKISADCPDVVISDIKMPVMDGLQLAKILREKYPAVRMILLSSFGDFEYAQQAIRYGVSDYILKPITMEKIGKIEQALQRINRTKERQNQNLKFIFNKDNAVEALLTAVKQNDRTAVEQFFFGDSCTDLMEQETSGAAGLFFINTLYSFLEECMSGNDALLTAEKKEKQNQFLALKKADNQRQFLTDLYHAAADKLGHLQYYVPKDIIRDVKKLVEKEYRSANFNISYIADTLHISVSYLSMLFMQKTGLHLSEYITSLRLNYAKQLLQDTAVPVLSVAQQSGYQDAKYFARVFRKYENMSPTEYRNGSTGAGHAQS